MEIGFLPLMLSVPTSIYEAGYLVSIFVLPLVLIQVIGGVYYLLRWFSPPAVSFRQATSKGWVIGSSFVLWGFIVLSQAILRLSGVL